MMLLSYVLLSLVAVVNIASLRAEESTLDINDNIQSMALYLSDRLPRELAALKIRKQNVSIQIEDLLAFDQMHYDGENAMIKAISTMQISEASKVIDIGSGYGGPARYVAWKTGAHVTALELQPEISYEAEKMTEMVGHTPTGSSKSGSASLIGLLDHQVGDVITWGPATFSSDSESTKYDGFMSMLAFLHVDNKKELFLSIGKTLKPGARFYIEDYFKRQDLNVDDLKVLKDIVSCGPLPTQSEYTDALQSAGFSNIQFDDNTANWATFVNGRYEAFTTNKVDRVAVLGERTYAALGLFYSSVARLFTEGRLGGTVITGIYMGNSTASANDEL